VYDASEEAGTKLFSANTAIHESANLTAQFAHTGDDHLDDNDSTLLFGKETRTPGTRSAHATTLEQGSALTRVGAIMGNLYVARTM
jgi:hypothetical protein